MRVRLALLIIILTCVVAEAREWSAFPVDGRAVVMMPADPVRIANTTARTSPPEVLYLADGNEIYMAGARLLSDHEKTKPFTSIVQDVLREYPPADFVGTFSEPVGELRSYRARARIGGRTVYVHIARSEDTLAVLTYRARLDHYTAAKFFDSLRFN